MNTPETKMRGSLTRLSIDMISPGLSVGYAANRVPIVAKQNEVRRTPPISAKGCTIGVLKRIIPAERGTSAMPVLYKNPLILSPSTTEWSETGADRRRSKVLVRRSMGIETGSIDEAENRIVIAMRPGTSIVGGASRPIANARNMKSGKSIPETMMLGFK
jgi:hypothetical protein